MKPDCFQAAISRIDAVNATDPRGIELPYARRLSDWVRQRAPGASAELQLAARAQHIARWQKPRETYPAGRLGYLQWREDLQQFHAATAAAILREAGGTEPEVTRVQDLIRKRDFPRDPEGRILEDALCLLFLETQLAETTAKTGEEKMIGILRKTWNKMTESARRLAMDLPMSDAQRQLVEKALAD